jgi:DMSO/TMAO reductase YedYZ heme-binding membrane subunit
LHRLVYVAAILSVWHYLWLDRDFKTWPLIFAAIIGILLAPRLPLARPLYKKRTSAE